MGIENIKYTAHAFERMTERDISRATVEAVVVAGAVEVERPGVHRYTLEGWVVVVDGCDVVTVYFDIAKRQRGDWGVKKKQRKGQEKRRRCNPQYIEGRGKVNIRQQEYYLRKMER